MLCFNQRFIKKDILGENLDYVIAPLYKRVVSYFIDLFAISFLVVICMFSANPDFLSFFNANPNDLNELQKIQYQQATSSFYTFLLLIYIPIYLFYQTFFIWYMGATLGKFITKTRCVDVIKFNNPSLKASFLRACLRLLSDTYLFYIGFFYAFFNPLNQTFHDKISKTVVINVR